MPRYPVRRPDAAVSAPGGVAAVDRALSVLTSFRDTDQGLTLSELSERTQLVPSGVLRALASLSHFGLVQRRLDGLYTLGPTCAQLHRTYAAGFRLQDVVQPILQQLADTTRESASFHVRQGEHRLVLYRVSSSHALSDQIQVGDLLPLDHGAGGHVLLAFSGAVGERYDQVRQDGFLALPVSDRSGDLGGISAPVFDAQGTLRGAVTLTMPAARYQAVHIAPVLEAAARLTQALGG